MQSFHVMLSTNKLNDESLVFRIWYILINFTMFTIKF